MEFPRYNHKLVPLGSIEQEQHSSTIHAIGGSTLDGSPVPTVERFDIGTRSWSSLEKGLLSEATSGLAVTLVPEDSIDCQEDCQCGVAGATRIVNGSVAQDDSSPWLGLLVAQGDRPLDSGCSANLVTLFLDGPLSPRWGPIGPSPQPTVCMTRVPRGCWWVTPGHCFLVSMKGDS